LRSVAGRQALGFPPCNRLVEYSRLRYPLHQQVHLAQKRLIAGIAFEVFELAIGLDDPVLNTSPRRLWRLQTDSGLGFVLATSGGIIGG
jgi:hypothetical protein